MPADEDEGAGGDVHYVTVEQDPDQSTEGCLSANADEGKPRFNIHLCFTFKVFSCSLLNYYVHLRSGVEWKLSCIILKYPLIVFTSLWLRYLLFYKDTVQVE
jgi:hypothetical protein